MITPKSTVNNNSVGPPPKNMVRSVTDYYPDPYVSVVEDYKQNKKGTLDSEGKKWNEHHDKVLRGLEEHKFDEAYYEKRVAGSLQEVIDFGASLPELLNRCEYLERECPEYLLEIVNRVIAGMKEDSDFTDLQVQQFWRLLLLCHQDCQNPLQAGGAAIFEPYHLNVPEGEMPRRAVPRKQSPAKREFERKEIQMMLDNNIIRPSSGPFAAPVCIAQTSKGEYRFCVDYRDLNKVTRADSYPLPLIEEVVSHLGTSKFRSTIDLKKCYWQFPMDDATREKTSFVVRSGQYEYMGCPLGLRNMPALCQRNMEVLLSGLNWICCMVFIDDIIIYSDTWEEHLRHIAAVFSALRSANLKVNLAKCHFVSKSIPYLGFLLTPEGLQENPRKIEAIQNVTSPKTRRKLRGFLGMCGYYRKFIKDFAEMAAPLHELTGETVKYEWGPEHEEAFVKLKAAMLEEVHLKLPDFSKPFILDVDASHRAIGAALIQVDETGQERVVQFASHTFHGSQKNWGITDKEGYAIVYYCNYFRQYLEMNKFLIRTDHRALVWLLKNKLKSARLERYALTLQHYDCEIEHRAGKKHVVPDFLSRLPIYNEEERLLLEKGFLHEGEKASMGKFLEKTNYRQDEEDVENLGKTTSTEGLVRRLSGLEEMSENWNLLVRAKSVSVRDMAVEQGKDPLCQDLLEFLSTQKLPEVGRRASTVKSIASQLYLTKDGVLKRRWYASNKELRDQIIVPKSLREEVLGYYHGTPHLGHFGATKTEKIIRDKFWWPRINADVSEWCRTCEVCQKTKLLDRTRYGQLYPIEVQSPWVQLGMDLMENLPVTTRGNREALVVMDYFTKGVVIIPLKDKRAVTILRKFKNRIVFTHGLPRP